MGRQALNDFISLNLIENEGNLLLVADEIFEFLKNPEYKKKFNKTFNDFMDFVYEKGETNGLGGCYSQLIGIKTNPETYEPMLTCSHSGLFFDLADMLNCLSAEQVSVDTLRDRVKELSKVETQVELYKKFPFLYKYIEVKKKKFLEHGDVYEIIQGYEASKKDPIAFNILKEKYEQKGENLEILYEKAKMFTDFRFLIINMSAYFINILKNNAKIEKWILEHPIDIKFTQNDMKKIMLYIMASYLKALENEEHNNQQMAAQKCLTIFESYLKKYEEKFLNDNTRIEFTIKELEDSNIKSDTKVERCMFNLSILKNLYQKILKKYPHLKAGIELPEIDKSLSYKENEKRTEDYIANLLNVTINDEKEQGAIDATEEVHKKLVQLEEDIKSNTLSKKEIREKAIVLKKLNMVLNDIKPRAIQTGTGKIFKDYYVYYYDNGMVALDRVDGFGALYIMPVNIYKMARYKDRLGDVKQIPGVEPVNHKNKDWLNIARNYIMTGTDGLTEKDMKDAELVASIDFPYTLEEIGKLQKQLEEEGHFTERVAKETKRRIEKIKEKEEIDKELKSNEFDNYSDQSEEKKQALDQLDGAQFEVLHSDEIDEVVASDKSFEELYEDWKKKHEVKKKTRNPVVTGITKRRAMIDDKYCCEWCGMQPEYSSGVHSHHILELSKGGADNIYNTVCICPSCHAYFHSGKAEPIDKYRLFMITKEHITQEDPEYLPQFNELLNKMFRPEEQEKYNEFYTYEWNYVNFKTK